jgi:hypothetical protein
MHRPSVGEEGKACDVSRRKGIEVELYREVSLHASLREGVCVNGVSSTNGKRIGGKRNDRVVPRAPLGVEYPRGKSS